MLSRNCVSSTVDYPLCTLVDRFHGDYCDGTSYFVGNTSKKKGQQSYGLSRVKQLFLLKNGCLRKLDGLGMRTEISKMVHISTFNLRIAVVTG